jgi:transcriptional regulator with XRE-family HTH domain
LLIVIPTVSIYAERIYLSIPKVSIGQIKAARMLLSWSQEELASRSGVSQPTIKRLEAVEGPIGGREETGAKIRRALEKAGVEFIPEDDGGRGVLLRKAKPSKKSK